MKQAARTVGASRVPFTDNGTEHYEIFSRALKKVLSTDLALETYAQIIDGLPTADIAYDRRSPGLFGDHPIEEHEELCPGAVERAKEFRESFDISVLTLDPQLIRAFSRAPVGTKAFCLRLLELIASSLHEIAALLHQLDLRLHHGDIEAVTNWVMEPDDVAHLRPTLLSHVLYMEHEVYPNGVADMVGYWAEDRIIGGVTVFDRRAEEAGAFPNIYLAPNRARTTNRYWQLLDDQQQALLKFLVAEDGDSETANCPLPILCTDENVERVSHQFAIARQVYRDIWERRPPTKEMLRFYAGRPQDAGDYPDINQLWEAIERQYPSTSSSPPAEEVSESNNTDQSEEEEERGDQR
ncbi:hypothetical protein QBC35DRAFT_396605 [Podospora australis]|uniref:Uncharacterized protein n=1 Tax=Podospora australis TaxID=1536484 RepID=A0AAN6WIZ0_9PEZI|nr:hypothetical protein QBC35DRAFT_396605 [Podospora australis]